MAEKSLGRSKSQISIAITGIDESSVKRSGRESKGVVWIGCAGIDKETSVKKFEIKGDREKFCEDTIWEGLNMLLDFIR
jgi:nicotinamide mononucleotide (NMN) deamidase PncC